MAFFDDIGKKISKAGQSAVQKTKDMGEVSKLNKSVSDNEKKIREYHLEIGRLYAEKHKNDAETEFAALIEGITACELEIETSKRKIREIKGVARCEKCGAEVSGNVAFCASCGAPLASPAEDSAPEQAPAAIKFCPECGNAVNEGTVFCSNCGVKLN